MRLAIAVTVMLMAAALLFAALPATDDFNRAEGALGANWTTVAGTPNISSNRASNGATGENIAVWTADTTNDDQYAQVAVYAGTGDRYMGPIVRASNSAITYYGCITQMASSVYLVRLVAGSQTTKTTISYTHADGDVIKISASGSNPVVVKCYKNGTEIGSISDSDASRIASGYGGMRLYNNSTNTAKVDNFETGNLAAAAIPPKRRLVTFQ